MDLASVKDIIVTVGYPIFTSIVCMWYVREQNNDARKERETVNKELCEKIEMLNDSITKLTALQLSYKERKQVVIDDYGD